MVADSSIGEIVGTATVQATRIVDRAITDVTHLNLLGVLNEGNRDDVIAQLGELREWADEARKALRRGPHSIEQHNANVRRRDAARGEQQPHPVGKVGAAARATVIVDE